MVISITIVSITNSVRLYTHIYSCNSVCTCVYVCVWVCLISRGLYIIAMGCRQKKIRCILVAFSCENVSLSLCGLRVFDNGTNPFGLKNTIQGFHVDTHGPMVSR